MYRSSYRRHRRLNKGRFFMFLLCLAVFIAVVTLALKGKLPFMPDDLAAKGGPTPTASASSTETATPTPEPTPWPTPEPQPPESTDPAVLKSSWQDPAIFTGPMAFSEDKKTFTSKDGSTTDYWVLQNSTPVDYKPQDEISFGKPGEYSDIEGVTTFRGNNYRDSAAFGSANVTEKKLEIVWTYDKLGAVSAEGSYWPGTGWTGQPLLVHWPQDVRQMMNINDSLKSKDLVEVIYPTLDGNIYFLDLETGEPTRNKIEVGYPMKGTGVIDPRGYPILYTGMGINGNGDKLTEWKYMMFNLIDQSSLYNIMGRDPVAFRKWGAFDSSAMVDKKTDTFIEAAENGLVYRVKLNTKFDKAAGTIAVSPQITRFRYRDSRQEDEGIENSAAYYKNYMYFADNGGTFVCLDINTMKPVWTYYVGDDTDSSTVIEETPDGVFLYTANEVDKRSKNNKNPTADANIRKFNALTGELIWQKDYSCYYQFYINGGVLGTPLIGKDDISDLIIYPICFTGSTQDGTMVALNKKTGEEVWNRKLSAYSWSSPVGIKGNDGKTYAVFCDFAGKMHLFDPKTGKDLDVISLGKNVESSPSVYNDMIVVGSYAQKIFGIKIK